MVILRGAGKIILITQVCKNEILGFKDLPMTFQPLQMFTTDHLISLEDVK